MSKSIRVNFIYNILLNVSAVIFPLITAPYVARVLEPDGVGLYNFSNTYAGYFALVALLGIPTYGVREVAKVKDDKKALSDIVSQLMSIAAIMTFSVTVIYLVTIAFVGKLSDNYLLFLLAGFAIYLAPFKVNWYYQGIEEFGFITLRTLVIRVFSLVCLFIFVKHKEDLIIYVLINVLSGVIADVWNYVKLLKSGIKPRLTLKGLKPHITPLLVLFASVIAISIYTLLDTVMLGFITNYDEVGYYSTAMQMSKVALSVITSLSIVAVPRISAFLSNNDYDKINELINKAFSVVAFMAFPVTVGLFCISPTFVPLFFGQDFYGSIIPLMILSTLIVIIGFNNLIGVQILIGTGHDKQYLHSVLVGAISNFLINCAFIPLWGCIGASIASVIAEVLVLVAAIYHVRKCTPVRLKSYKDIAKALTGSLLLIPILLLLKQYVSGWTLIVLFTIIGGGFYFLFEFLFKNSSVNIFTPLNLNRFKY